MLGSTTQFQGNNHHEGMKTNRPAAQKRDYFGLFGNRTTNKRLFGNEDKTWRSRDFREKHEGAVYNMKIKMCFW